MTKIGSGVNKMSIKRKQVILNKIRCKIMDSRRRKKKTEAKPHAEKQGGILKFLKNVIMPCKKANSGAPEEDETNHPKGKHRKAKIPLAMKQTVWVNQFGEVYKHKCVTKWCHRVITVFDFEVGHNVPESKGGATSPENLRPICRQCNIGMGNRYTIDEWSKKAFLKK